MCMSRCSYSPLLVLIVPPSLQSFTGESGRYLLELVGAGLCFLALGLTLSVRWLTAGGVLTFTGIGLRALYDFGRRAPIWLTLAVAGMALLGVGVLLLFQRKRWDRARGRVARWWRQSPDAPRRSSGPGNR
jgi:hypothetical protein